MIGHQGRQMNRDLEGLAARAAPAVFVVLWSTGFIATKYALGGAEPLTYLAIRMAVVVGLMAIIVAITRPQWPDRAGIAHSVVAGLLVHGFYLGGTAVAIAHSIPAGLSALIPGLQPILTSTLANRWLGERVTPLQWSGLLLGLVGVVLILHDRPMGGEAGWGLAGQRRIAGQHHARHAVPAALLRPDRLAFGQPRAVHRGHGLVRRRSVAVREQCGALDR